MHFVHIQDVIADNLQLTTKVKVCGPKRDTFKRETRVVARGTQ